MLWFLFPTNEDRQEQLDDGQAHMLCIQMLHVSGSVYLGCGRAFLKHCNQSAETYGLFAASDGDDPNYRLQEGPTDREGSWKAWCRVESINR